MPRPGTRWIGACALALVGVLPGCGPEPGAVAVVHAEPPAAASTTTTSTSTTSTTAAARVCCAYTVERAGRSRVTTSSAPAPPAAPAAAPAVTPPPAGGAGASTTVSSTAYCLTGTMASGRRTYRGAVAANAWPLGTRLWVSASPYGPGVFTVEDRIGHGSHLDFAMPGDCAGARQWGRRSVQVRRA